MLKQQKSDIKALEQTLLFLSQNATELALLPDAPAAITNIGSQINALYAIDTEVQGLTKVNTLSKAQIREQLNIATVQLANRGIAFAVSTNNIALQQTLGSNISNLRKMAEITYRDYVQMIHNTLSAEIATIPPVYLIVAADLTAQQNLIDDFSDEMPGANNRISRIKTLNANFATTLNDAKATAKKLDILVNMLQFSHAVFHKSYYAARKPQKVTANVRALVFTILDKTTSAPLYKAKATFLSQKTQKNISRSTTPSGTITIPTLAEGVYEGTVSEAGYHEFSYTVSIRDGVTLKKTIRLEPDANANRDAR